LVASVPSTVVTATNAVSLESRNNPGIRTREVFHGKVSASHELNVHRLPCAGRVCRPFDLAVRAFVVNIAGARNSGGRVCVDRRYGGKDSSEKDLREHYEDSEVGM
jgi:hypothetical protein